MVLYLQRGRRPTAWTASDMVSCPFDCLTASCRERSGPAFRASRRPTFIFCTPWPAPPFTRLSMALVTMIVPSPSVARVDVAEVGVGDDGHARGVHQPHEMLAAIGFVIQIAQLRLLTGAVGEGIGRGEDAAHHGRGVRREGDAEVVGAGGQPLVQLLGDFGPVAVVEQAVGAEVLRARGVVCALARLFARPRRACLGVDNDRAR